ncbi:hypothetical protein [Plastoroseomonas hellenica]|uniref:Uncharacterized protein n=1 Tax=Plastoroseomonas hellenica TaxID=2687306 RepID=A0ABS5F7F3_9PROT|nr:hypothetical protein [Plastoroseomonas hellenica]MBR0647003.1 hypothetical protein [Plastoroseomonas hellenica]MBR0668489.1 hypothetical protein [Plastoroseomonas hellenica]
MRIEYSREGLPTAIYEPGDFVRLRRDEEGEVVTARAGDWGQVTRVEHGNLDIRFAGHSRPRTSDLPVARDVPAWIVDPCDRRGRITQLQRDLDTARARAG